MGKVKIVTDSTADMTVEELKMYDIEMIPLSISVNGEVFLDKLGLESAQFLDMMRSSKELPKSSQPSAGTFLDVYNRLAADGSEIISIHMTGGMSGTVRSAESAASMTDAKVTVIDSKFISKALSFQVIEAAKMASEGKSAAEIAERVAVIQNQTGLIIVIDTLENLVKGGRIGKASAFIGSLLNIKPIAILEGGVLNPVAKARSQSQIVKNLINRFLADTKGKIVKGVGIAHANGYGLSEKVRDAVKEVSGIENIKIEGTTAVISTHAGEGAMALMYYWD
ncbi:DegV family protein [Peribacillus cavernae]|uniref:DegV family protein n=1 Tax=Peribacillus cavernae TaxID=1674310 RepID=A0A433HWP6_9BACI|nr:DegV family protein [Peribacillus cavernae]MDQ0217969.1 DegV family protein with EDD domain [Peribacillus cavernae]RUQ32614.1 DegV family protein [Peribacillus cavernae]